MIFFLIHFFFLLSFKYTTKRTQQSIYNWCFGNFAYMFDTFTSDDYLLKEMRMNRAALLLACAFNGWSSCRLDSSVQSFSSSAERNELTSPHTFVLPQEKILHFSLILCFKFWYMGNSNSPNMAWPQRFNKACFHWGTASANKERGRELRGGEGREIRAPCHPLSWGWGE